MELDEVTGWLDGLDIGGTIVELDAGSGWWSALLAEKGELWIYDGNDAALDLARKRLVAHGLMAHLHQRDALAPPERQVDWLVGAYLLGRGAAADRIAARLEVARDWLKTDGRFVFIEAATMNAATSTDATIDGPGGSIRTFTAPDLTSALGAAGFVDIDVRASATAFVMGTARAA